MPDEDREETLYHGTTRDVAQEILATRKFQQQETYFASTRALAEFFAKRSSSKRAGHGPAVVRVVLYRSDLELWKRNRLVRSKGFDEGDQPSLYCKTQLVFSAEAMRFLNRDMFPGDLAVESIYPK
jgi:hypothetical protein